MANNKVLIVDDDEHIVELIKLYMDKEGFDTVTANNGKKAVELVKSEAPAIVILDVMMPEMDGWQVCREIRRVSNIPIIMLTAKGETFDKVLGLELGADDYMVKPFEPKELLARVKAVLRRSDTKESNAEKEIVFPNLTTNLSNYELKINGNIVEVPPKELELLYFLASNPNRVFTREQLLEEVWGFDYFGDSRTVDVHIKRLREKLEGCGRTDTGVHAENYVCNFFTNSRIPSEKLPYALNTYLPNDIVCFEAEDTDENFHSNSSAVKKRYVYKILNREFPDAVMNRYSWHYKYPLDIEKMRIAAKAFIGEHDFIGFASSGFSVKTTVREIYSLDVDKNGDIITIDVVGNGFLYNMVRIIAGTLVFVGGGKINPNDMADIINSKDRERAGITAPPQGLCLKEVYY